MKFLLVLIVLAFSGDNHGLGYPCKQNSFKQFTKCRGGGFTNYNGVTPVSRSQCFDFCSDNEFGYFGWNSDGGFCRCYPCENGVQPHSVRDWPGTTNTNLLFKTNNEDFGECNDITPEEQDMPEPVEDTNDGQGYPCKASSFKQYTKCNGRDWVNGANDNALTTREDCFNNCYTDKKYEYFGWNSDGTFCRCYKCSSGPRKTSQRDYPGAENTNLLFKATGSEAGECVDVTESGSACDQGNAPDGTRCTQDEQCESGTCCERYKVCGNQASGTQIALDGKAYNGVSKRWDLPINEDTWACSKVSSTEMTVSAAEGCSGVPTWAYGMFALLILNPLIFLWTRSEKGSEYESLLDEE